MDHTTMVPGAIDHGAMDHGAMDHGAMGHEMMDHGAMNHAAMEHGASEGHQASSPHAMMMAMSFHGGCNEVILFDFWKISTVGGLVSDCLMHPPPPQPAHSSNSADSALYFHYAHSSN